MIHVMYILICIYIYIYIFIYLYIYIYIHIYVYIYIYVYVYRYVIGHIHICVHDMWDVGMFQKVADKMATSHLPHSQVATRRAFLSLSICQVRIFPASDHFFLISLVPSSVCFFVLPLGIPVQFSVRQVFWNHQEHISAFGRILNSVQWCLDVTAMTQQAMKIAGTVNHRFGPMFQAYFQGISPEYMAYICLYMVQHLHFRILEFPLNDVVPRSSTRKFTKNDPAMSRGWKIQFHSRLGDFQGLCTSTGG